MRGTKPIMVAVAVSVMMLVTDGQSFAQQASNPNPYRAIEGWAKLPQGMEWGQVSGVELDAHGNLWVIHRTDPPILEFDPSGNLLKSFGSGMFVQPHSLHFDRDGNLWATDGGSMDGKGNQLFKFSPEGKVLLTLGKAGVAGDGPDAFNRLSDVVTAPNGDIFIADGHVNSRVVKYSKDGKFIKAWGTKGTGPGEFDTPHAIAIDSRGRIFVGDRANNRIQIFDQDGKFIDQWKQFGRPTGLFIDKNDVLYVADDESNPTRNPGWMPGISIGSARDGKVTAFIPAMNTERAVADSGGNIYSAVLGGKTVRKYVK
jgi:sugar lactone lactonase YvrE